MRMKVVSWKTFLIFLAMLLIENIPSLQPSLGCGPWSQAHMCLVVLGGVVVVGVARR